MVTRYNVMAVFHTGVVHGMTKISPRISNDSLYGGTFTYLPYSP